MLRQPQSVAAKLGKCMSTSQPQKLSSGQKRFGQVTLGQVVEGGVVELVGVFAA